MGGGKTGSSSKATDADAGHSTKGAGADIPDGYKYVFGRLVKI